MEKVINLDRNGNVIAGNKTLEAAKAEDIEALTVIETDGSRLIAVKRTDLSIDDARARELAIADNRTSETGLLWDEQEIQRLIDEGADLETFFPELYEAEPEAIEPENAEPKAAVNPEAIGKTLKLGKCHQNVLVFVKGRADEAVRACGDVEIEFPEGFMEAEEDAREPEI